MKEYSFGEIVVVDAPMALSEIQRIAGIGFGDMVKAVVDLERNVMTLNAELHADEEAFMLEQGSRQQDLWGINLYPEKYPTDWIEFDSMINIRPRQGNRSRHVEDQAVRDRITKIVSSFIV